MSKHIFILGTNSDLARAEIYSLYKKVSNIGQNIVILADELKPEIALQKLGGTIKIATYLQTIDQLTDINTDLIKKLLDLDSSDHKISFGFSLYHDHYANYKKILKIFLTTKKDLQKQGLSCRLVVAKEPELSSVIVAKNKLIGRELLIIKHEQKYILALTQAVQNFTDYSQRDINRPIRDDRSGMLPIKVAQMMLNLAGPKLYPTILDPFCGSGTILQEAALLGYPTIYGSDISRHTIQAAQTNIDWLKKEFNLKNKIILSTNPAEKLSQIFQAQSIDLIVSEPFMGEARLIKATHQSKVLADLAQDLSQLYLQVFQEFKKILKPGGKIIFIFPIFTSPKNNFYTLPDLAIKKLGFVKQMTPGHLDKPSKNGNLIYARPGQIVQREIAIYSIQAN